MHALKRSQDLAGEEADVLRSGTLFGVSGDPPSSVLAKDNGGEQTEKEHAKSTDASTGACVHRRVLFLHTYSVDQRSRSSLHATVNLLATCMLHPINQSSILRHPEPVPHQSPASPGFLPFSQVKPKQNGRKLSADRKYKSSETNREFAHDKSRPRSTPKGKYTLCVMCLFMRSLFLCHTLAQTHANAQVQPNVRR